MAFLIGTEDSEMGTVAQEFADQWKVSLKVLTDTTIEEFLPAMNMDTPVFVEKGFLPNETHQYEELLKTITEKNIPALSNEKIFLRMETVNEDRQFFHSSAVHVIGEVNAENNTQVPSTIIANRTRFTRPPELVYNKVSVSEGNVTLGLPLYSYDVRIDEQRWISPSRVSTSCEVNITLRATETSKLIEFDLTYSMESSELGPQIRMANNTNHARGFFIDSANVYFFQGDDPKQPEYGDGWRPGDQFAPHATNFDVRLTESSEHFVEVEGHAGRNPHVAVRGGHRRGNQREIVEKQFSLRTNRTGWNFFYTDLDGESPRPL